MSSGKRLAKNTMMLYFRQILILLVSLYTVRVVLNTLGVEDFGIYNVVAGIVSMFSFLSGSLAAASQRYFSYEIGKGEEESLNKVFSVTFYIYLIFVFVILLLAETIGFWFVSKKLVIPSSRLLAAKVIYHFSIVSFVLTIITTPFMSCIIAHEEMNVYAYVSIIEAALKLLVVFLLKLIFFDKLIVYGFLLMLISAINTTIYRTYCKRHYRECKIIVFWDFELAKNIISFIGWNFWGAGSRVIKNQFINIIINQFVGPAANAARTISIQVRNALSSFSQNFSMALQPQIVKTYAAKENEKMLSLIFKGCKFTFFLMLFLSAPLLAEMEFVLKLWLKEIPNYTVVFTQLIIVDTLFDAFSYPLQSAFQATGNVKYQQISIGNIILLNIPISYLLLKMGYGVEIIYIVSIFFTLLSFIVRILLLSKQLDFFKLKLFLMESILPTIVVLILSAIVLFFTKKILQGSLHVIIILIIMYVEMFCMICSIGTSISERRLIIEYVKNKFRRNNEVKKNT